MATPISATADHSGTSRAASLSWFRSIRSRLYLAFGFAAAITVVGSLIALYEFTSIGGTSTEIVSFSIPATVQSLRLAEETAGLVASAPRLMTAADERRRVAVADEITEQARSLAARVEHLQTLEGGRNTEIDAAQAAMVDLLETLNRAVTERIAISNQRQAMTLSIRKAHDELLEAITPVVDDANFDVMTASQEAGNKASGNLLASLRRLLEVQAEANLLAGLLTEASMVTEAARLQPLRDLIDASRRKIEANLGAIAEPEQRAKLTGLYDRLAAIAGKDGVVALRNRELNSQNEAELAFTATQSEAVKLKQAVDQLVERQGEVVRTIAARVQEQLRSGRILIVLFSIAAFVLALFSGYYVLRAITRPLGRLVAAMDVVRQGDFTAQMDVDRRDEFTFLGPRVNSFGGGRVCVGEVGEESIQVGASVTEIVASAKQHQATASEIAATTAQIGATSKEISATSKELVKTMGEVSTVAEQTATLADSGQTGLSHMEGTMGRVMEATDSINAKLAVLNEKAGNISKVTTTITKVADQTNLLSLNAAIEAEKAGEYGRGFAVVATEIRRLADQTAVASYDIEVIVKEIQSAVSASVMGMDKFSEETRRGLEEIQQVGGQLSQVIEQVQTLTPRFEAVNEGMRSQTTGAEQITGAFVQLTEAMQRGKHTPARLSRFCRCSVSSRSRKRRPG